MGFCIATKQTLTKLTLKLKLRAKRTKKKDNLQINTHKSFTVTHLNANGHK